MRLPELSSGVHRLLPNPTDGGYQEIQRTMYTGVPQDSPLCDMFSHNPSNSLTARGIPSAEIVPFDGELRQCAAIQNPHDDLGPILV